MGDDEHITLEYEFTRDDYLRWTRTRQNEAMRGAQWHKYRRYNAGNLAVAIGMTALALILAATKWKRVLDQQDLFLGGVILSIGAGAAGAWWQLAQYQKRYSKRALALQLERNADCEQARAWQGRLRVTLSHEFLVIEMSRGVSSLRWSHVGEIASDGERLTIATGSESQLPIPVRAFADATAMDQFVALATKYRDAVPSSRQSLTELLSSRDFSCPGCQYNLRGLKENKCPECGRAVTVAEVVPEGRP